MPGHMHSQVLVVNQANGFMKGVSGLWQSLSGDVVLTPAEISYRNSCGLYLYYRQALAATEVTEVLLPILQGRNPTHYQICDFVHSASVMYAPIFHPKTFCLSL